VIGNDVVDLGDPETHPGAQHARFDERVFSDAEREALAASPDRVRLRWMLWAAKESAFKLAKKRDPRVHFAPRRFEVTIASENIHWVRHEGLSLALRVEIRSGYVHVIARDEAAAGSVCVSGVEPVRPGDDARATVRSLACTRLSAALGVAASQLSIPRSATPPALRLRGVPLPLDVSLSHHGRFVAFACELESPQLLEIA
jgi:phosphopantetheinyl transferase (holo-ACP synthase)